MCRALFEFSVKEDSVKQAKYCKCECMKWLIWYQNAAKASRIEYISISYYTVHTIAIIVFEVYWTNLLSAIAYYTVTNFIFWKINRRI